MLKRILIVTTLVAAFLLTGLVVMAAGGTSVGDAILPVGQTQTVPANSAQWYRFDTGGQKKPALVTLDAGSANGLRLAVYTPSAIASWQQQGNKLQAIGMGGPTQLHTLAWDGVVDQAGTYYAVVYNDTGASVDVKVNVTGDSVTTIVAPTPTRAVDPLVTPTAIGKGITGKLAFVDSEGGNIYTVNGDGTNLKQLTTGLDPQWNHAGTQIAFGRQGPTPGIYVINADGSGERLLYNTTEPRAPAWSPDDSQIAFSFQGTTKGGKQRCGSFRGHKFCFDTPATLQWNLGLVNLSDGTFKDVRTSNYAFTPTWLPDGTIAYNDPSIGLMTTTANGPESENSFIGDLRITSPAYNPLRIMSPQYSPDGKAHHLYRPAATDMANCPGKCR